ncbi:MAG: TatD family hydrolase [Parcubacteria group bacterium]|jgi:TatD DNase family protein
MIDTHAHLDFENFDEDREEVIRRAFDNGVKKVINIGIDLETSKKSIALAQKHENIFAAAGVHPEYFTKHATCNMKQGWIGELRDLAKNKKVVATGEIGLDYYHITHNIKHGAKELNDIKESQKAGFVSQINLAKELGLPVAVHCRDAWEDVHEIISKFSQNSAFPFFEHSSQNSSKAIFSKFVLHCYSGNTDDTEKFLKLPNVYFSFSGNITYPKPILRSEKLAKVVRMIPLDKMMLDSDSPFLAPQEKRGKRNEPANVRYIAEKIADIKEISVAEVEKITDENAEIFFGIGQ